MQSGIIKSYLYELLMATRNIKYFDNTTGLWVDFTASDTIPATAVTTCKAGFTLVIEKIEEIIL